MHSAHKSPPPPEEDLTHCCPLGYGCGTSFFLPSYHCVETLQATPWNNSWTARCCCQRNTFFVITCFTPEICKTCKKKKTCLHSPESCRLIKSMLDYCWPYSKSCQIFFVLPVFQTSRLTLVTVQLLLLYHYVVMQLQLMMRIITVDFAN